MIRHIKNPNGTYRIVLKDVEVRIEGGKQEYALFGDIANLLGQYLDTGLSPTEIEKMKKERVR